jgi:hypothetical protein
MKTKITFLLTGIIAGLVCVMPGPSFLSIVTLTWGVGPAFFVAVVAGVMITGARRHLQADVLRYMAGLVVCFITYLLALMVFAAVGGFSPDWFGFRPSPNFDQFGVDVVLGLLAAAIFAAAGIAVFAFVLTGRWSNSLLRRLLLAGLITIIITFIVNYPFRGYWSFYGALIPLGTSLFCGAVGSHIWNIRKQPLEAAPDA